jgi:hypothetical protein
MDVDQAARAVPDCHDVGAQLGAPRWRSNKAERDVQRIAHERRPLRRDGSVIAVRSTR